MFQLNRHYYSTLFKTTLMKYPLVWFTVGLMIISSQALTQSTDKGFDPQTNGLVRAVKVLKNGQILIGGDFTEVGTNVSQAYLALLDSNGKLDQQFRPDLDGRVLGLAEQPDGKLLVHGVFNVVNGTAQQRLVRLRIDGSIDFTFAHNISDPIHTFALKNNGQLLVAAGLGATSLMLLDNNGGTLQQLATLNDPSGNPRVNAITTQEDQKILLGGEFSQVNGVNTRHLARISPSGVLDTNFSLQIQPNGRVTDVAIQQGGDIIIAGEFTQVAGLNQAHLARIYPTGVLDEDFTPSIDAPVEKASMTEDGRIAMAGFFNEINGNNAVGYNMFALLKISGELDTSFNPLQPPNGGISDFDFQSDGGIVVGGTFTQFGNIERLHVARYNKNSSIDQAFTGDGVENGAAIHALSKNVNNRFLLGGHFAQFGDNPVAHFNWLEPAGNVSANPVFIATDGPIHSIVQLPSGKVLIGGDFSQVNGEAWANIALLNGNTSSIDQNFAASTNGTVYAIHPYTNGRVLIAGNFSQANFQNSHNIALITSNGALEQGFSPEVNNTIKTVAVDEFNRIVIGGSFGEVNGFDRQKLARLILLGNTALVDSFDPSPLGNVLSLAFDQNRDLLVGGTFSKMAGQDRAGIARFHSDDSLDDRLNLPLNSGGYVTGFATQMDGCVYVAGDFETVAGLDRQNTAKLCPDDSGQMIVDTDFIYHTSHPVSGLLLQEDGKLVLAGEFVTGNSIYAGGLTRLSTDEASLQSLGLSHNKIRWLNNQSMPASALPPTWSLSINGGTTIDMGTMQLNRGQWEALLPPFVEEQVLLDITINRYHTSGLGNGSGLMYQSQYRRRYTGDVIFIDGFE